MKKGIILTIAGFTFLAGCGHQEQNAPITPKWPGAAYHIAFDTQASKPNPSGVTIPAIKFTANPEALERRACLVVRIDDAGAAKNKPLMNQLVMGPVDINGAAGALPADYMDEADKGLASLLESYGIKGKIKISVMLVRSSISAQPGDDEINEKRLSDWLPTDLVVTKGHTGR